MREIWFHELSNEETVMFLEWLGQATVHPNESIRISQTDKVFLKKLVERGVFETHYPSVWFHDNEVNQLVGLVRLVVTPLGQAIKWAFELGRGW